MARTDRRGSLTLLIGAAAALYRQGTAKLGSDAPIFAIIGEADGYKQCSEVPSFLLSTIFLAVLNRTPVATLRAAIHKGGLHLVEPLCVLALAWALGNAISELNTAQYLVGVLQDGLPHALLPSIVFLLAAGISFSTGTSFGTMGTLMPLALPLAIQLQTSPEIMLATASAVLSGATWGDHCHHSDTTILSSAGAGCEHISHVRTSYICLDNRCGILLLCSLPVGWGVPGLSVFFWGRSHVSPSSSERTSTKLKNQRLFRLHLIEFKLAQQSSRRCTDR